MAELGEEQSALVILFALLERRGRNYVRTEEQLPIDRAVAAYPVLDQRAIEELRRGELQDRFPRDHVIRLEPPTRNRQAVAALWCHWNFDGRRTPKCGFIYGLWSMVPQIPVDGAAPGGRRIPSFVGYRFETPNDRGEAHRYYHMQPCRSMGDLTVPDITIALPISTHVPAVPIPAATSLELLLCLILSIYGFETFREIKAEIEQTRDARNLTLAAALTQICSLETVT